MDVEADTTIGRIHRAVEYVESNLDTRLTVATIAGEALYSPYHFHRTFTALTGETIMEYVRRRRLTVAAGLLRETDRPIVRIALDCGFESQEAFTRAFRQQFGAPPGRFRRSSDDVRIRFRHPYSLESLQSLPGVITMEPAFVDLPAFSVVGLSGRFTPDKTEGIPALWDRFVSQWSAAGHPFPEKSYGICFDEGDATDVDHPPFRYMAAFDRAEAAFEGMEEEEVPANRYAVFTHRGSVQRIGDTYRYIFGTWMPASGYRRAPGPDFELYDDRFDAETLTGELDIYVPIEETDPTE